MYVFKQKVVRDKKKKHLTLHSNIRKICGQLVQRLDIMILGVTGMGKDAFEMHIVAWG